MRQDVAAKLRQINREFYETFAEEFASTRRRLQPGALRAILAVSHQASVLDLGRGAGELARGLAKRGHRGPYLGIDASPFILDLARERARFPWARFRLADLTNDEWAGEMTERYGHIFLLAALHHIPGDERRIRLLKQTAECLAPSGSLTLSVWDFGASPRLRKRVVPWDVVGLTQADVDPDDHLMDWRHGGVGLRYVHLFSESELSALALRTGFQVGDRYRSDGEAGRLGLYQVWKREDRARSATA